MLETAYLGRTAEEQASDAARSTTDERTFSNQYVGRFNQLRIRPSDRGLLMTFISEGAHLTESRLAAMFIKQSEYTSVTVSWEFEDETPLPRPAFPCWFPEMQTEADFGTTTDSESEDEAAGHDGLYGLLEDLLTAYALWRWLTDKHPDLSAGYAAKWNDAVENAKRRLCSGRLMKPRKRLIK